jgi:rhodanese-related sulfurtransferase
MKKLLTFTIIALVFSTMTVLGQTKSLNAQDFKKTIETTKLLLIDVRTPHEFAQGHIAKAININVSDPAFTQKALKQIGKSQTIAIYCRSGRRSKAALSMLGDLKIKIFELNNGINEWQQAGFKLVK